MVAEDGYCLAIDQGTTGTRCIIFDHEGSKVSSSYLEHKQIYPYPGWVEHDPLEIIDNMFAVIKEAVKSSKIQSEEIVAVGVTNQRETVVLWNPETGQPYYNAIVWQDTRTKEICEKLKIQGYDESLIKPNTGLFLSTYFSGPKIKWIFKNIPKVLEYSGLGKVFFGNIDTWMIWWLTGGPKGGSHVTDYTNGSRTMLMDINKLEWDQEILSLLKIPEKILPELKPSSDKNFYGYTREDSIFSSKIPVCGDLGDQQAALVGQSCFREGESKNTYGTGCFMLSNIGNSPKLSKEGLLTTCAYSFEEGKTVYALEGSIAVAGSVVQWLRDNLKIIGSASETEKIAESIKDEGSSGVYFVPAFNGLYAPYWDSDARGIICGLTSFIKRDHLVHAALESICWQTRDVFETMARASGAGLEILKVDGGAVANNYLMQLQADTLGTKVVRPQFFETSSLGAAYAAGLAVSFWKNTNELAKLWKMDRIFEPEWSDNKREHLYIGWKEAVKLSMGWLRKVS